MPAEVQGTSFETRYVEVLDRAFETYTRWFEPMQAYFRKLHPRADNVSPGVYKRTLRAKALDTLRGLLPAATRANVGIYGTGQAYEALLLRMRANPLAEVRWYADAMLEELRKVIPAFLKRVEPAGSWELWSRYIADTRRAVAEVAGDLLQGAEAASRPEVVLAEFDPDGGDGGRGRGTLRGVRSSGGSVAKDRPRDERGGTIARDPGLRGTARKPTPQTGAGLRTHALPLRHPGSITGHSGICSGIACCRSNGSR